MRAITITSRVIVFRSSSSDISLCGITVALDIKFDGCWTQNALFISVERYFPMSKPGFIEMLMLGSHLSKTDPDITEEWEGNNATAMIDDVNGVLRLGMREEWDKKWDERHDEWNDWLMGNGEVSSRGKDIENKETANKTQQDSLLQAPTSAQKWWAALLVGMLFAIVSSCWSYGITNWFSKRCVGFSTSRPGGPTLVGLLIHTIIFIILIRIILG